MRSIRMLQRIGSAVHRTFSRREVIVRPITISFRASSSSTSPGKEISIPLTHHRGKAAAGKSWQELSDAHRQAWSELGWSEKAWDSGAVDDQPMTEFMSWEELNTAQQGAAMYGLGFDESSWNAAHADETTGHSLTVTKDNDNEVGDVLSDGVSFGKQLLGLVGQAKPWVKMVARAAGRNAPIFHAAAEAVELAQEYMTDPVEVKDLETIIYLDDSGSMQGAHLGEGMDVLNEIAPHLYGLPTRLVLFGSTKETLAVREEGINTTLASLRWQGMSGGTYLWKMIEDDITSMYRPGPGHLRVYIITDGEDNLSPTGYAGMHGMDPMMKALLSAGYDIEFHIILLGQNQAASKRYHDLALSTGGSFVHIDPSKSGKDLTTLLERTRKEGSERQAVMTDYTKRVSSGSGTKFNWLPQLPPPKKSK